MSTNSLTMILDNIYPMKSSSPKVSSNSGTTWAMLLCFALIGFYLTHGKQYLNTSVHPFYHILIVSTLAIITIFTLGCVLHMLLIGDKPIDELAHELQQQNNDLLDYATHTHYRLKELERAVKQNIALIRPRSAESLSQLRRIITALAQRTETVKQLLLTDNNINIISAHELLTSDLVISEHCLHSLIPDSPLAPIKADQLLASIESMIHEIETDLRRVELKQKRAG